LRIESIYNINEYALSFQRGEERGFDFFFRDLFPSLCFFANRLLDNRCEAEDIVSGAFIKIWQRHSQFDDAKNIRSYLYQIVRNDCLKFFQQKKKAILLQKEIEYFAIVETPDYFRTEIIRSDFFGELHKAVSQLSPQCSKVFKMLYFQGKTVKEIAKELNLSQSTVKTQKSRALIFLRKKFIPS